MIKDLLNWKKTPKIPFSNKEKQRDALVQKITAALPALKAFAMGLCGEDMAADDLVQSACERALGRLHQVSNASGVQSWLFRIVYTQWQDTLRKRQRRKVNLILLSKAETSAFTVSKGSGETNLITALDMQSGLGMLSEEHRASVVLVSMLGYSYEEAADIQGLPKGTVASRVARGRSLLAKFFKVDKQHHIDSKAYKEGAVHERLQ